MLSKRAEHIIRQFPDPILVLNNNFQVEYVNATLEEMLSISAKAILEKQIHELGLDAYEGWTTLKKELTIYSANESVNFGNQCSNNPRTPDLLNDPLEPKNILGHDRNTKTLVLDEKVYSFEIFKIGDATNADTGIVIRFRDITEDVEITDQMIQTEKMSGLGTLAAGLAHELNNPLYSIVGLSEMIINENIMEKINLFAQRIIDNSQKMASVVENLAVYSQSNIVKGREVVNINERLDAALELALLTDHSKSITIDKNYCSMAFLRAKPEEVEQIFFNIISNSVQAMKEKGKLTLSSSHIENEKIIVKIQDTGEGVPKEFIAKVFDPFFTTKDQGQGTGLGLTVVYQLLKKYDGTIKLDSVIGEGTTVEIHWPTPKEPGFQG
jgi:two-component system NtrC family sensor kinase